MEQERIRITTDNIDDWIADPERPFLYDVYATHIFLTRGGERRATANHLKVCASDVKEAVYHTEIFFKYVQGVGDGEVLTICEVMIDRRAQKDEKTFASDGDPNANANVRLEASLILKIA